MAGMLSKLLAAAVLAAEVVVAHPLVSERLLRRAEIDVSGLKDSYDYVIVGGGQAAVVLATRLTEDPDVTVLMIEYGYFVTWNPDINTALSSMTYTQDVQYNITSPPQESIGGYQQSVYAACCVGGGSQINGMLLNRGSAADYDAWERLGNPGWGWDGLFPYFKKSSQFTPPNPDAAEEFDMTWDPSSYSEDGPIQLSFSSWQYPGLKNMHDGLIEAGATRTIDGQGGDAHGLIWYPTALDNETAHRSFSVNEYYQPNEDRPGLNILTGFRVDEVTFNDKKHATGIVMSERVLEGEEAQTEGRLTVKAKKEVIVSAGAIHSPQVLQRSGIGPRALLEEAGIDVLVDLPGVGGNLMDHPVTIYINQFNDNHELNPDTALSDPEFAAWAQREYEERGDGPLRIATGNMGGELPLATVDPEGYAALAAEYAAIDAEEYLPGSYSPEQVAGYKAMQPVLADLLSRPDNAFLELPLQAGAVYPLVLIKNLSRGTVLLNTTDVYAEPVVDYNTCRVPQDLKILRSGLRFVRRFSETPSMQELQPFEILPGTGVQTDEDFMAYLGTNGNVISSTAHNSGTCVMMPRELGGVVAANLRVYGVTGLSVVDASVMPVIPGAHTCSTVYAIAEKAADMIKKRHSACPAKKH